MNACIKLTIFLLSTIFLCSCETVRVGGGTSAPPPSPKPEVRKGPPAHAKAHGFRRKHQYYYYPSSKVYYSSERKIYFWLEGDGWKVGASLPSGISLNAEGKVSVSIEEETPYIHYEENYKSKHPGKGKGKGKAKGRYK